MKNTKEEKIKEYIEKLGLEKYQKELNQIGNKISQENPGNPAYEKRESFMYKRTVEAHFFNEIIKQDKVKILTFEDWKNQSSYEKSAL